MKKLFLCILIFASVIASGSATTFYVRTDGDNYDGRPGTVNSPSGAWRDIQWACVKANASDTIIVVDGTYYEGGLYIDDKKGTKDKPLVIRALNRQKVFIRSLSGGSAVNIKGCVGVVFDGFDVTFNNPASSYLFGIATEDSFWVTIKNCHVHDIGSSGIQINDGEYIFVENNIVRDNGKNTGNPNGSGISSFHPKYSPDYQAGDFGIVIRNNIVFENVCPFALPGFNSPVDGNGIILDDFRNIQTQYGGGQPGGYYHPVLIENNLVFNNGGRGVHIYHTDNVTVRNNTLYHNNFELSKYFGFGWNGDLNIDESTGCKIYNNIVVMRPTNTQGYSFLVSNDAEVHNNLIIGPDGRKVFANQNPVSGTFTADNKIQPTSNQGYVKFVNATYNVDPFDVLNPQFSRFFGLSSDSPAINTGNNSNRASTDLEGKTRPLGGVVDMGCYEGAGSTGDTQAPSVPANLTLTNATTSSISFSWSASTDNVGVSGYDVYNNGSLAGSTAATNIVVGGLTASTSYSFTVRAKDAAGNVSGISSALVASTIAGAGLSGLNGEFFTQFGYGVASASAAINGVPASYTFTANMIDYPSNGASITTNWGAWLGLSSSGIPSESVETSTLKLSGFIQIEPEFDVQGGNATIEVDFALGSHGFTGVKINNSQIFLDETNWNFSTTSSRVSFPGPGYYPIEIIHAIGFDPSGIELYSSIGSNVNPGRGTAQASSIVPANVLFKQMPDGSTGSVVANLRVISTTSSSIDLAWDASGGSTAGYDVYNGSSLVGSTAATTFSVAGLSANTTYTFTVKSKNGSGTILGTSSPLSASTTGASTEPTPTNVRSTGATSTTINLKWDAAGGNTAGYHVYRNGSYVGSTAATDLNISGLTPNTSYTFTVRAATSSGDMLGLSAPFVVSTSSSGRFSAESQVFVSETVLTAFPNPSTIGEAISITSDIHANKDVQIYVNDITGKQVLSKKMHFSNQTARLSLSLPKGMYVLVVTDGKKAEQTKLLIH